MQQQYQQQQSQQTNYFKDPTNTNSNKKPQNTFLYSVLNLQNNATKDQIKKSYYQLSRTLHPDRNINSKSFNKLESTIIKYDFLTIQRAYHILSDDILRTVYDAYGEKGVEVLNSSNFKQVYQYLVKGWVINPSIRNQTAILKYIGYILEIRNRTDQHKNQPFLLFLNIDIDFSELFNSFNKIQSNFSLSKLSLISLQSFLNYQLKINSLFMKNDLIHQIRRENFYDKTSSFKNKMQEGARFIYEFNNGSQLKPEYKLSLESNFLNRQSTLIYVNFEQSRKIDKNLDFGDVQKMQAGSLIQGFSPYFHLSNERQLTTNLNAHSEIQLIGSNFNFEVYTVYNSSSGHQITENGFRIDQTETLFTKFIYIFSQFDNLSFNFSKSLNGNNELEISYTKLLKSFISALALHLNISLIISQFEGIKFQFFLTYGNILSIKVPIKICGSKDLLQKIETDQQYEEDEYLNNYSLEASANQKANQTFSDLVFAFVGPLFLFNIGRLILKPIRNQLWKRRIKHDFNEKGQNFIQKLRNAYIEQNLIRHESWQNQRKEYNKNGLLIVKALQGSNLKYDDFLESSNCESSGHNRFMKEARQQYRIFAYSSCPNHFYSNDKGLYHCLGTYSSPYLLQNQQKTNSENFDENIDFDCPNSIDISIVLQQQVQNSRLSIDMFKIENMLGVCAPFSSNDTFNKQLLICYVFNKQQHLKLFEFDLNNVSNQNEYLICLP